MMCEIGWYMIFLGTILCFIGGAMTPKEDKRYKTGKKIMNPRTAQTLYLAVV